MWLEFSFVSEINETFKVLQFSAVWLCLVQGYCWVKTSLCDLMRPNAAVPSFTLVPSSLTPWAFLWLMHAICENCSHIWCGLVDDTSLILNFTHIWAECPIIHCIGTLFLFLHYASIHLTLLLLLLYSCLLPVEPLSGGSHLKHLKWSISDQWVSLQGARLCCWTSVYSPTHSLGGMSVRHQGWHRDGQGCFPND